MKKLLTLLIAFVFIISSAGCSKKNINNEGSNEVNIAIVTLSKDEDPLYYAGGKNIADKINAKKNADKKYLATAKHIVLPNNFISNADKARNKMLDIANNKSINVVVVSTSKTGLLPFVKELKLKMPDTMFISAPMGENPQQLAESLDFNFAEDTSPNGDKIAQLSLELGAKRIIQLYSDEDIKENLNMKNEVESIKKGAADNGLQYEAIKMADYTGSNTKEELKLDVDAVINKKIKQYGEDIAFIGTNRYMDEVIALSALQKKFIVPSLSVVNTADMYRSILKIDDIDRRKYSYDIINTEITNALKPYAMNFKIAGQISRYNIFLPEAGCELPIEIIGKGEKIKIACREANLEKILTEKTKTRAGYKKLPGHDNFWYVKLDLVTY